MKQTIASIRKEGRGGVKMFQAKVVCAVCHKKIEKGEEFIARLRMPYHDGMVRIKKFLEQEAQII